MKLFGRDLPFYTQKEYQAVEAEKNFILESVKQDSVIDKQVDEIQGKIKSYSSGIFGLDYFYAGSGAVNKIITVTVPKLLEYASFLPNAPQSIEYITDACFAQGYKFVLNPGKTENKVLLEELETWAERVNDNNESLVDVLQQMIRWSAMVGDGYIEKVPNLLGNKVVALYAIPANQMVIYSDQELAKRGLFKLTGYAKILQTATPPTSPTLKPDEVLHLKYVDRGDAYGHTPLEDNAITSETIIKILVYNYKKFANEIRHSFHIHFNNGNEQEAQRWYQMYKNQYLGETRSGMPLMTWGEDLVATQLTPDHANFDYLDFMDRMGRQHAPSLFNLAISEIDNSGTTYNNADQGHRTTMLNTIFPLQTKLEQLVNSQILPEWEGEEEPTYEFVIEREYLSASYDKGNVLLPATQAGLVTTNEFRAIIDPKNLPPIEEDWADEFIKQQAPAQNMGDTTTANQNTVSTKEFENMTDVFQKLERQMKMKYNKKS